MSVTQEAPWYLLEPGRPGGSGVTITHTLRGWRRCLPGWQSGAKPRSPPTSTHKRRQAPPGSPAVAHPRRTSTGKKAAPERPAHSAERRWRRKAPWVNRSARGRSPSIRCGWMGVSWGWDYDTPPRGVTCASLNLAIFDRFLPF